MHILRSKKRFAKESYYKKSEIAVAILIASTMSLLRLLYCNRQRLKRFILQEGAHIKIKTSYTACTCISKY